MLKVSIGPSSSHTHGPWQAARRFVARLIDADVQIGRITVDLYGSLALTGRGHGTDVALMLGLSGADPQTVALDEVRDAPARCRETRRLALPNGLEINFDPEIDIVYHGSEVLAAHPNGMVFSAYSGGESEAISRVDAYSVGGGFVVFDGDDDAADSDIRLPYPITCAADLLRHCEREGLRLAEVIRRNERSIRTDEEIDSAALAIWEVMKAAISRGCNATGELPGGLGVTRRAGRIVTQVITSDSPQSADEWMHGFRSQTLSFQRILKLVGGFAIAVNEENAAFGRIVTAPTNGSAGVIPAALAYLLYLSERKDTVGESDIVDFLLVAGAIGGVFKHGATISAALGGCQAEIGVSSAMAAAALAEATGGSPAQALMAAEIAMEHHLGLTCDPIGGLVQVPCIERNSMGAIKAITAALLATDADASRAKVTLDDVVRTMWTTAVDMHSRYKETSLGGLAVNVSVGVTEC